VESATRADGEGADSVAEARCRLAESLGPLGREAEAEEQFHQAVVAMEQAHGERHWAVAVPLLGLASLRLRQGRTEETEAGLRRALELADMAGQTAIANQAREQLVDLLVELGRVAEAVPISQAALDSQEAAADRDRSLDQMERHARVLALAGDGSAERYRRRAELLRRARARESGPAS
jgi:hypothetical protein